MKYKLRIVALCLLPVLATWMSIGHWSDPIAGNAVVAAQTPDCMDTSFCAEIIDATIADAHADTLLHRNPSRASRHGHVDLDRLLRAGVDLQIFALATFAPSMSSVGDDVCGSLKSRNRIALLFAGKEPFRPHTWISAEARIDRMLSRFSAGLDTPDDEGRRLIAIRSAQDLDGVLRRQARGEPVVGGVLAVEGFYWAGDDPETISSQLDHLERNGILIIGLTQRASNHLAGSSEDCAERGGLSRLGRHTVREIWAKGMILDLAHAAPAVIADVAEMARQGEIGPVVVSHAGIRANCDRDRNLSDEDIRNVVRAGGVIGIGYWDWVACWSPTEPLVEIRRRIVAGFHSALLAMDTPSFRQEMGQDFDPLRHLALGSDFDGATTMPVDVSGLPWLLEGLAAAEGAGNRPFHHDAIKAIAGENLVRVLRMGLSRRQSAD